MNLLSAFLAIASLSSFNFNTYSFKATKWSLCAPISIPFSSFFALFIFATHSFHGFRHLNILAYRPWCILILTMGRHLFLTQIPLHRLPILVLQMSIHIRRGGHFAHHILWNCRAP